MTASMYQIKYKITSLTVFIYNRALYILITCMFDRIIIQVWLENISMDSFLIIHSFNYLRQ